MISKNVELKNKGSEVGYEEIAEVLEVSWEELTRMISTNRITDGYTLSAYSMLATRK